MSVIRLPGDLLRVAFNRDELLTRPAALPPATVRSAMTTALMPLDPQSGGTWIACNDLGLIFAVLNVNLSAGAEAGSKSRGTLIPPLVGHQSVDDVMRAAAGKCFTEFAPFRLIVLDHARYGVIMFDGACVHTTLKPLERSFMLTSSGLGDQQVERPRRELFDQVISPDAANAAQQDAFHAHRWPDRGQLSVCMSRADARTVSVTTIQLSKSDVQMNYQPIDEAAAVQASLRLRGACRDCTT